MSMRHFKVNSKTHSIDTSTEGRVEREGELEVGEAQRLLVPQASCRHTLLGGACLHAVLDVREQLCEQRFGSRIGLVAIAAEPLQESLQLSR